MTTLLWILAVAFLLGFYVTWTAGRLDRLHARVDASWAALDAQLVRRAAAARAVAAHLRAAQDVIDGIGTVSATVAAAAIALGRVQEEKHRTLSMLRTGRVAGQLMSTIGVDDVDVDVDPDSYRAEITAAVSWR